MTVIPFRKDSSLPEAGPEREHRQATQLLNAAMSFGRLILRKYGQLAPFAFARDREGQIVREMLEIPRLPRDPERLWKLLSEHVADRVRRGMIEGVALCANVSMAEPSAEGYTDAVIVTIEQENGQALKVTVPYRIYGGQLKNLIPRRIALGEMVVVETEPQMFRRSS